MEFTNVDFFSIIKCFISINIDKKFIILKKVLFKYLNGQKTTFFISYISGLFLRGKQEIT